MSEGLWIVIGVLLGFVGTYVLHRLAENRRKKHLRIVARNIIGLEIIHNLEILEHMEKSVKETIKDTSLFYRATIPLRSEVFNQFLDLPSLSVLDNLEQRFFVEIFSQLNLVAREYNSWPQEIGKVILNLGAKKAVSQNLLDYITRLRMNLVQLLCEICLREKEGLQEKLKDIYKKVQIFENTHDSKVSGRAGKSSDYKSTYESGKAQLEYLVVWEHDWQECPLEVIELRHSKEDGSL